MDEKKINLVIFGVSSGIGKYLFNEFKKLKINVIGFSSKKNEHKDILFYKYNYTNNIKKTFINLKKKKLNTAIIICNGANGKVGRLENLNLNDFKKSFDINFFSVLEIIHTYLNSFKNVKKKIIVFSGGGAFNPFVKFDSYATSKAALVRLIENLAYEYKKELQINAIAPGFNFTNIHRKLLKSNSKSQIGENYYKFLLKNRKKKHTFGNIIEFLKLIFFSKTYNLSGKTISINFDNWNDKMFKKNIKKINSSDYLTLRRINKKPY
jgi:short-subunit dehydrogenase